MALGRKTGGRQKGTRNRAAAEARAATEATGIMPLDYMLTVMRDASAELKRRDAMAIAAAPYLHQKLTPTESVAVRVASKGDKPNAEDCGIHVVFVRPHPRTESDDENGEIGV